MDHITNELMTTTATLEPALSDDAGDPHVADFGLLPAAQTAGVSTAADTFDINAVATESEHIDAAKIEELKQTLAACGKDLRSADRKVAKGRIEKCQALARVALAGSTAFTAPEVLVALAKETGIAATKASWKNPQLVLLKIIHPEMEAKTASMCARALNYAAAAEVPPERIADFLYEHGIVALAREEAKRQKLRRSGSTGEPSVEDPMTVLRREVAGVPLPASLALDGLPEEGQVALMLVGRHEAQLVAWAVDTDEKSAAAAVRRVLKTRNVAPDSD